MNIFTIIKDAIFNDVTKAMDGTPYTGRWTRKRDAWTWERGQVTITRTPRGGLHLHGNTGAAKLGNITAGGHYELIQYLTRTLGLYDDAETLKELAHRYGITWEESAEQAGRRRRADLARIAAPILEAEAKDPANANTEGAKYIKRRGWDKFQAVGLITGKAIKTIVEAAKTAQEERTEEEIYNDLRALLYVGEDGNTTRPVTLTNYTDGRADAFAVRSTDPDTTERKYLFSAGGGRKPFCNELADGRRAVVVEGQADALRLQSLGVANVISFGNSTPGAELFKLLQRHAITDVVYIPDVEILGDGTRKTELMDRAAEALAGATDESGDPLNLRVYVADLGADGLGAGAKMDADSWGLKATPEEAAELVANAPRLWWWRLERIQDETIRRSQAGQLTPEEAQRIQARVIEIYQAERRPEDRQAIRNYITASVVSDGREVGPLGFYSSLNITPRVLDEYDTIERNKQYNAEAREIAEEMKRATEGGANPAALSALAARLQALNAKGSGTRQEWEKQTARNWSDELEDMRNQRDALDVTRWPLGCFTDPKTNIKSEWRQRRGCCVQFWPADITTFCAPTSHGKTMILFQSMLYLAQDDRDAGRFRKYLYISMEETHAQLLTRALNAYATGEHLDAEGLAGRKELIKKRLKGEKPTARAYGSGGGTADVTEAVTAEIDAAADDFQNNVFPRLDLIHTEAPTEAITSTITQYVNRYAADGVEVGAVFVDYSQLLTSEERSSARNYELKTICKLLKETAAALGIPFVIAAQLNRISISDTLDEITMANIGEGADIERISHDIYLVWQTDKTNADRYTKEDEATLKNEARSRARRVLTFNPDSGRIERRGGYLYVERIKAREGITDVWALLPYDGPSGKIKGTDEYIINTLATGQAGKRK